MDNKEDETPVDLLLKEAQLKKLQTEIYKIEQETSELKKGWLSRGLTVETVLKSIIGSVAVFVVVSTIIAPIYADKERRLIAKADSITDAKNQADELIKLKQAQLKSLTDSIYVYRNRISLLKRDVIIAKGDYQSMAERLNNIKQDSIKRNEYSVVLHNAVNSYRSCLYAAFDSYINYIKNDQNLITGVALGNGIGIEYTPIIKGKAMKCKKEFREYIYRLNGVKLDPVVDKAIDSTENKVNTFFKGIFRAVITNPMYTTLSSDFNMNLDDSFNELENIIDRRKKL